jgi:hypothetical protein
LFGPQKCRLGTGTRRFTWHCPSLCVLRLGRRFGHRSRDDLCRARITLLGCNQCRPAPVARRRRATMDSCGNAGSLSCAIGWLLFCFFLGILSQAARRVSKYFLGPESPPRAPSPPAKTTQVVILGGGFAGVTTAEHLEKQFRDDSTVSFTLISETNSWLFTPMLVEVATSGLEPTHITAPLRTSLKRTGILRSRVRSIDLERQQVQVNEEGRQTRLQHYDHLVLALGSVSNYLSRQYCSC